MAKDFYASLLQEEAPRLGEEIALEQGWLAPAQVEERAGQLGKTDYARYLRRLVADTGHD